jgi:hypothetical protein
MLGVINAEWADRPIASRANGSWRAARQKLKFVPIRSGRQAELR